MRKFNGLLVAAGIGLVLATNPAVAAKHCDWRMDLPINLSVDYDKLFLRSASGEPVVSYFNPITGGVRLFTVEKEVTGQYHNNLRDFEMRVGSGGHLPKGMKFAEFGDFIGDNPSITLGDTTISRRLEIYDPASPELFGDFDGSICDDVGYEYLLVEKAGAPSRKLVLLAMLPKKTRTFKKNPCGNDPFEIEEYRYVHMVAPDISGFMKYDDNSFVIQEYGGPVMFPYLLRIDKSMNSCGIDSKTLFLVDKVLIDDARLAVRRKIDQVFKNEQKSSTPLSKLFYQEINQRLEALKAGE
jgi:hypothetical protein